MTATELSHLFQQFEGKRILVIGDIMLDEFVWGKAGRISPEAPVPVIDIEDEEFMLGGAGNVILNLIALGAFPVAAGILGDDAWQEKIDAILDAAGVDSDCVLQDQTIRTTVKTRFMAHSTQARQQLIRADRGTPVPLSDSMQARLIEKVIEKLATVRAVIISDYDKGVVTPAVFTAIAEESYRRGIPVFVDPKIQNRDKYIGVTLVKPNHREAETLSGIAITDEESLLRAGRAICSKLAAKFVLITMGGQGMTLFADDPDFVPVKLKAHEREVFDATGAGDTVISTLTLAYAAGASMLEAAIVANAAAGLVVSKAGTATVSRREIADVLNGRPIPKGIWSEVLEERKRQDAQWGGPAHDDDHTFMEWLEFISNQLEKAAGVEMDHEGPTQTTEEERRERLVKIAALAVAAIESMDRR